MSDESRRRRNRLDVSDRMDDSVLASPLAPEDADRRARKCSDRGFDQKFGDSAVDGPTETVEDDLLAQRRGRAFLDEGPEELRVPNGKSWNLEDSQLLGGVGPGPGNPRDEAVLEIAALHSESTRRLPTGTGPLLPGVDVFPH